MDATESAILLELFLDLDTPEGLRAELLEGEILIEPPGDGHHAHLLSELADQVWQESATEMQMSQHKGIRLAAFGEPLTIPAPFEFDLDTKDFL
ncbi:hypothetical protein [Kitasatospora sp. NPDC097691]|uniref:hypothetical protein n=1 Tax=Kitasatospora sp. NPDC097691 TaxID=3157231 RepID=UPI00332A47F6